MEDEVVVDYHDCLLRKSDVELLNDSQWLNDNIIAFAFE
jgi:sentrin-specific protease 8